MSEAEGLVDWLNNPTTTTEPFSVGLFRDALEALREGDVAEMPDGWPFYALDDEGNARLFVYRRLSV